MHGTFTDVSYMFCGRVPLPLPQMPWWPQFMPLSLMKIDQRARAGRACEHVQHAAERAVHRGVIAAK